MDFTEAILSFDSSSAEDCILQYHDYIIPQDGLFCNWTWDSLLCWPPTKANSGIKQKCSLVKGQRGLDPT
ncbi:PDF receptor-like, partial [Ctenocephalides felis]|uniref:PDF receptor-like n=1 Tax=Ctenocephalides felis TaxID=7515 RepID=UPI000E6E31C7